MLETILDTQQLSVYRHLLVRAGATESELRTGSGLPSDPLRRVLEELEDKGLVSRTPGKNPRFTASSPELAFEALLARREEELKRARLEVDDLLRNLSSERVRVGELAPVELASGLQATRQRWIQVQRSARSIVRIIDRPPHVVSGMPNPVELELLKNGIEYRLLYDETSFDIPGKLDAAQACIAAGEHARVGHDLPLKLVMADDSIALTYEPEGGEIRDGLIVHASPLLDGLSQLFALLWEHSAPFGASALQEAEVDPVDRRILELMAVGTKDEVIARRLGIGLRTVRRRISALMNQLDAKTRFQAGINAKRKGWIG